MTTPICAQIQTCVQCGSGFRYKELRPLCSRKCHGAALRVPVLERFWSRVQVAGPDDCWPWTGEVNNKGYARFVLHWGPPRVRVLGHRFSYALATGEDVEGRVVMHSCDNPPCCNPAHLSLGTQADNIADCIAKGRADHRGLAFGRGMSETQRRRLLQERNRRAS